MTITDFAAKYGLLFVAVLLIYLAPTFVAASRRTRHALAIAMVNIGLGFTLLGWIGAMAWALLAPKGRAGTYVAFAQYTCPVCGQVDMVPHDRPCAGSGNLDHFRVRRFCLCGAEMAFEGYTDSPLNFIEKESEES